MLRPPLLRPGEAIGCFSPSSAVTVWAARRMARAKKFLEEKGFQVVMGTLSSKEDNYRSGSASQRAEELNALICDPKVRCLMATFGGMNSNALLPLIDYAALIKDPKIVIGYSDITALLLGIHQKCQMLVFHGPTLSAFGGLEQQAREATWRSFQSVCITGMCRVLRPPPMFHPDRYSGWAKQTMAVQEVSNRGWRVDPSPRRNSTEIRLATEPNALLTENYVVQGRLLGGNLNTMIGAVWGSEYMPEITQDTLLLIDDNAKDVAMLEREFTHLLLNGILNKIRGVILAKHNHFDDCGTGRAPVEVLQEVASYAGRWKAAAKPAASAPVKPPLIMISNVDCGHTMPMVTVPLGIQAAVVGNGNIVLLERWWEGPLDDSNEAV